MFRSRLVPAFAAGVLVLSACGSSAAVVSDVEVVPAATQAEAPASTDTAAESASPEEAAAQGQATGTLTLSSGEVYELSVRSCETQATDPNSLLNEDFVDISADTADGYRFTVLNARSADSPPAKAAVGLRSERPEGGGSPAVDYINLGAGDDPSLTPLDVNGTQVTGEALLDGKLSSTTPFGEMVNATFVFNCA